MEPPHANDTRLPLGNGSAEESAELIDRSDLASSGVATMPPVMSLLTIAPFFFWGTAMVAMKSVMPHTSPLFVAGFRLVPAGILVLLAAAIAGRPQPQGWKAWGWIALFAVIDATLFQGFLAEGLQRTGAGIGSVTIDSQPLIVAVLSCVFLGERIGWIGWLGLAIGVIGSSPLGEPDIGLLLATIFPSNHNRPNPRTRIKTRYSPAGSSTSVAMRTKTGSFQLERIPQSSNR